MTRIERNLYTLIRSRFVDQTALPLPRRILAQRFRVSSQNEEDGLTLALINLAGNDKPALSGSRGRRQRRQHRLPRGNLRLDRVDGRRPRKMRRATCRQVCVRYGVDVKQVWLTRDNVNEVVRDHGLDGQIDLLSVDLDGNDYWVWRALGACSPRIVILAFNAAFGAERAVTMPYDPAFDRAASTEGAQGYYGASLAAFEQLGREKGYRLVIVEPKGVHAYLLRNDVASEIPASPARALHPHPGANAHPLFDRLAEAGLALVDVASMVGER